MMTRTLALAALLLLPTAPAGAQTFTPQSPSELSVSYQVEQMGGPRVLVWGDVVNGGGTTADRVVVLAEALDRQGHVVASGRGYVAGVVPPKGRSPFEARLLAPATAVRYRARVESFQFVVH
jgi:hypothetical protein